MKLIKYVVGLVIALCAIPSISHAQTIQFLASGSSAIYNELGQGAQSSSLTNTPCIWTHGSDSTNVFYTDSRPSPSVNENGAFWVVWNANGGSCASPTVNASLNIYADMNLDSVLGQRCYFETSSAGVSGCVLTLTATEVGVAGINALCVPPSGMTGCPAGSMYGPDTALPAAIQSALNGQHATAAATDIRPEDGKFASLRMFTACGSPIQRQPFDQVLRQTFGLGYQTGTTGVGVAVQSFYSTKTFHVLDFNIAGNDPITGKAVPAYTVLTVGAQPIIVVVSPSPTGGTGLSAASDITTSTLQLFYDGVSGRSTDLIGPTTTNAVTTLVREPLSGTYNTFEFSGPNSNQYHAGQDLFNCTGNTFAQNPMHLGGNNGTISSFRNRVIGTGEMVSTLQGASTDTLGYFFWGGQNAVGFTGTNGKYLTVNGVDPIQNAYTDGAIPTAALGNLSNVTFKNLNAGDYPLWSAVRVVCASPTPAGCSNIVKAAGALTGQNDFVTPANMKIWRSHFNLQAIGEGVQANGNTINPATPNDLCNSTGALSEFGGDAGGSTVLKQVNFDFCSDFGNIDGLIGENN
jgi:hypothetical protein